MDIKTKEYEVIVLFSGYRKSVLKTEPEGNLSNSTCTLIKGKINIIVDTMTAWDAPKFQNTLEKHGLTCQDINYVICTNGHFNRLGCNHLFKNAYAHIVGYCISNKDRYYNFDFSSGKPLIIDDGVRVIPTPGHTMQDISVIVSTKNGIYAITGDLFESEYDEKIWQNLNPFNAQLQKKHRNEILKYADFIIPAHGPMFKSSNMLTENYGPCKIYSRKGIIDFTGI